MSDALALLGAQLRGEETPISAQVVDAEGEAPTSGEYALLFESIREGYLLHYERSRLLRGHDDDLALLAGDYLYALGLSRLAEHGDDRAVALLAELIGNCARLHAEGRGEEVPELWDRTADALGLR